MTNKMAVNQRAQYLDVNGNPLSMGRVTFLDVGTPDLKSIYADPDLITELNNPVLLDAGGFVPESSIFYGEGNYSVLVERVTNPGEAIPVYDEEYLVPIVVGSDSTIPTGNVINVPSVEELTNLDIGSSTFVNCAQYYNREVTDQGGGLFKWYANSTATTDLGMVFAWTGSPAVGRFFRIGDGQSIRTSWYGVATSTGASMNNRILQAAAYCNDTRPILEFTESEIEITGTINIDVESVKINSGVRFKQFDTNFIGKIIFNSELVEVESISQQLVSNVSASINVVFTNPYVRTYPAYWGANGDGITDEYTSFYNASFSDAQLVIHKNYRLDAIGAGGATDLSIPSLYLMGTTGIIAPTLLDSFTVNKCDSDEYAVGNFRATMNDFSNYVINTESPKGRWFTNGTIDSTLISTLFPVLTNNYLLWDKRTTYDVTNSGADDVSTVHEVKQGTLFKCNTGVSWGQFIAGDYQIFTYDSSVPSFIASNIIAAWFGVSKFASDANNTTAIENAIDAADNSTIDFKGIKLSVSPTVNINNADVTIKNLNIEFNGTGDSITVLNSEVRFIDCKIDSITSDSDCKITFKDCEMIFSTASHNLILLGKDITVSNCTFGSVNGDWVGNIQLSSAGTKSTTETVVFQDNTIIGGDIDIYTSSINNTVNDNSFLNIKAFLPNTDKSYLTIHGGTNTSIKDNNFRGVAIVGTAEVTMIEFSGSNESVLGLYCSNSYSVETIDSGNTFKDHSVSGYANDGHIATVKPMNIGSNKGLGTKYAGYVESATGTGEFDVFQDLIFPYYNDSYTAGGAPYFHLTTGCDGFTATGNGLGFYTESGGCTGTGGNVQVKVTCQLRASTGYSITQIGMLNVSVEFTDQARID